MMDLNKIKTIGSGLMRPEGVMAADDGSVYTADGRGQIARIDKTGHTRFFGDVGGTPNGICIDTNGRCIIANIGNGEVQSLSRDGSHQVLLTHAQGRRIPAPNFPYLDFAGRLWVSNSTENENIDASLQNPKPDGCVVVIENGNARIVAHGMYFANGLTLDKKEEHLYVAETMQQDILRFKILPDGSLSEAEVFGPKPLCKMGYPDGIAFDEAGNLWVTFPSRNAVGYLTPAGDLEMFIDDREGKVLQRPTNICFGGQDRKTAFIGSLDGHSIPCFEVPFPGMRLVHQKN
ncbi:MAG: SMP-30/gluconolactonase/LRE family protein [Desulfobacteraceae bacterium]|nr:SMP-30/gluconolactonase/LRE family protein [Desulfobacteraceae bacterium]MBU4055196.1 SMP-30/gluconolactonase/LRE family protein [Pseudomonadota bacterium]